MLLGQSLFQSVVDRLEEEAKDEEETGAAGADFRIRGLGAGFVAPVDRHAAAMESDLEAYMAFLPDETPPAAEDAASIIEDTSKPAPMPSHLLRLSEKEIAEDLAISASDDAATLTEKRRQFARQNHPDMVAAEFRDNATTRMTLANQLIDRAIETLRWK